MDYLNIVVPSSIKKTVHFTSLSIVSRSLLETRYQHAPGGANPSVCRSPSTAALVNWTASARRKRFQAAALHHAWQRHESLDSKLTLQERFLAGSVGDNEEQGHWHPSIQISLYRT